MDITWGFNFVLVHAFLYGIIKTANERNILSNLLILAWAIRLAVNNYMRHKGEDWRYKELRDKWMKKGKCYYYAASFFLIFVVQSII